MRTLHKICEELFHYFLIVGGVLTFTAFVFIATMFYGGAL